MYEPLKVVSWASAKGHCPIRYSVVSDEEMVFVFGSGNDEFEFAFDRRALHNLLEAGVEATTEMKTYVELDDEPHRPAVVSSSARLSRSASMKNASSATS